MVQSLNGTELDARALDGSEAQLHDLPDQRLSWEPRTVSRWWFLAPAALGTSLIVSLALVGGWLAGRADVRATLLAPETMPIAFGFGLLTLACGVGLVVNGLALSVFLRERHRSLLEQEGLVEEISQEFDRVRGQATRDRDRVSLLEGRLSRAIASAERAERESRWLLERVRHLEAPAPSAPAPSPGRQGPVAVHVVPERDEERPGRAQAEPRPSGRTG